MSKQNSFTLLEMLIAMAILGVVVASMYTAFRGGTSSWTAGDARSQRCQNARAALEVISRDLKQAFTRSGTNLQFQGSNGTWTDGVTVRAADSIYFTSASNYPNASTDYDLEEVGYYLSTTNRSLYRMENDTINADLTDGTGTEMCLHITGLDLRYHDGSSWSSDGDYTKSTTSPKAVEITLTAEDEDQIEDPRNFKTIVYIP